MISVEGLTKRFGATTAVDNLTFSIRPGHVTGFLGPNGAGKSTTMRMILGLDRPDAGRATIDGRAFTEHPAPAHVAGALLSAEHMSPKTSVVDHLRWVAAATGASPSRIAPQLEIVGLADMDNRQIGNLSLGMRQRLGLATALFCDPEVLILDEPLNGLDPAGILWLRELLREFVSDGRTVLVSSHLMNEMQKTADHVVVIRHGRLVADLPLAELERRTTSTIVARGPELTPIVDALTEEGTRVDVAPGGGEISAHDVEARRLSELSIRFGLPLDFLGPQQEGLEEAFLAMTDPKEPA